MIHAATTMTPLRISWAGGGTDFPDFYREHGGAVCSTTIDKYVYVTVKRHSPLFKEAYRLNYAESEHAQSLDEIKNDIARECLRRVHVDPPLYIATAADLPAFSGLGSSSAFAVGLLHCLHLLRGERPSAAQLAEEACDVEIMMLGRPQGVQDAMACAHGGLNLIRFSKGEMGGTSLTPLYAPVGFGLVEQSLLLWTGLERNAADVLGEQQANIPERIGVLESLRDMAEECAGLLRRSTFDPEQFGALLDRGWRAKKRLASTISLREIDKAYDMALDLGAYGGKIAGAGGGGFLYLVAPPERHAAIAEMLDMPPTPFALEVRGSRLLSVI